MSEYGDATRIIRSAGLSSSSVAARCLVVIAITKFLPDLLWGTITLVSWGLVCLNTGIKKPLLTIVSNGFNK